VVKGDSNCPAGPGEQDQAGAGVFGFFEVFEAADRDFDFGFVAGRGVCCRQAGGLGDFGLAFRPAGGGFQENVGAGLAFDVKPEVFGSAEAAVDVFVAQGVEPQVDDAAGDALDAGRAPGAGGLVSGGAGLFVLFPAAFFLFRGRWLLLCDVWVCTGGKYLRAPPCRNSF